MREFNLKYTGRSQKLEMMDLLAATQWIGYDQTKIIIIIIIITNFALKVKSQSTVIVG